MIDCSTGGIVLEGFPIGISGFFELTTFVKDLAKLKMSLRTARVKQDCLLKCGDGIFVEEVKLYAFMELICFINECFGQVSVDLEQTGIVLDCLPVCLTSFF